jgi:hypothetical protein
MRAFSAVCPSTGVPVWKTIIERSSSSNDPGGRGIIRRTNRPRGQSQPQRSPDEELPAGDSVCCSAEGWLLYREPPSLDNSHSQAMRHRSLLLAIIARPHPLCPYAYTHYDVITGLELPVATLYHIV